QRQGEDCAGRQGQRQGSRLSHLRRYYRARRRVEKDFECGPRVSLGQARRPELPGADLRLAGRSRRQGRVRAHLVPPQHRLTSTSAVTPRSLEGGVSNRFNCTSSPHTAHTAEQIEAAKSEQSVDANGADAKKTVQSVLYRKTSMAQGFLANMTIDK